MMYIEDGLDWFINQYEQFRIESIAFPPLGCGNGGLNWDEVKIVMQTRLKELLIDIEIYEPMELS